VPVASSTATYSGLPAHRGRAILSPWAPNRVRPSTGLRFGRRQSGQRKHARKPTGSPARRGISACLAFSVRRKDLPDTKVGTLTQALYDEAKKKNWTVIGMKNDWKKIFSFE
jgi:hypothetical protein